MVDDVLSTDDLFRPLELRGKLVHIHWYQYPDRYVVFWLISTHFAVVALFFAENHATGHVISIIKIFYYSYDSLVLLSDIGLNTLPDSGDPPVPKQWCVSHHWLEDSDRFNEWMNEEDYEMIMVCY